MSRSFDQFASLLFLLFGAAFLYESMKISDSAYGSSVGPAIFPMGLGIVLILLSIRLFWETRKYVAANGKAQKLDYKRFLMILGGAVLYGLLMEPLGYVLTTFLFLTVGFQVMDRGGWWKSLLIAACFSMGVYYVFVEVLEGTLPGFPDWLF